MSNYTAYHIHTFFSLLDSATDYKDYVDLAVKNGQKAIAFTEHGKTSGWVSKKMYCDEQGIKYIHGVEMYLTETLNEKIRDNYHTVLLAKNWEGVKELNKLVSISCQEDHTYYKNRLTFDEFLNISDNIISTSACLGSPLHQLPRSHPRYMELAKKYTFFEIQPHIDEKQAEYNRYLFDLSKTLNTPLIVGTDTHSSTDYKAECREILMLGKGITFEDGETDESGFDMTYKTYDELVKMFERQNALPQEIYLTALENTNLLDELVEDFELDTSIKYPILYGSTEEDSAKCAETVERKFKEKLEAGIIPEYQKEAFRLAIDEEMRVFNKLEMAGFMLSMGELVSWCKEQGMAIGTARGSVGGSRVAYILDIIDLNPETWHTVFSRFCNEDREEIGDIDIDVVDEDRPYIFQYIIDRFGSDKTARVASFGTLKDKSIIDEVGRALTNKYKKNHPHEAPLYKNNPYSLEKIKVIKKEFASNPEATKKKYPDIFYYFDGLLDVKVSQSVHPAGMVISPISLPEYYGVFNKDGEQCLMMDMNEAHEVGAAKYDFLVLKTVQVIRDTCNYIGIPYPKTHEVDWNDEKVWESIADSALCIFQFESPYAFECIKKYKPKNLFEMTLVNACIRPSGASYRNELLARKPNSNPSQLIDDLLKENNGYLVYQEDVIKFLQQICGLSGSEADNIRRAIARKQQDRLDKAMPRILDGYCLKSDKDRATAEEEARTFIQILEDSASYMFGYNHAMAYCMLGYLCAYYRYYYPLAFITAFLNNVANDEDIDNGTLLAKQKNIQIIQPKFGYSKSNYFYNTEANVISKGIASIKHLSINASDELYELSQQKKYVYFSDLLHDITEFTCVDARQLEILVKVDYFADFGNQRELFAINDVSEFFKHGQAKQIKKDKVEGTQYEEIIKRYSTDKTKAGKEAKSYTLLDPVSIIRDCEKYILSLNLPDLSLALKVKNYADVMGYAGYVTNNPNDRNKLYIKEVYPVRRKKDNEIFAYSIVYYSLGNGINNRMTVFNSKFNRDPIKKDDIIICKQWERNGKYFRLLNYEHFYS